MPRAAAADTGYICLQCLSRPARSARLCLQQIQKAGNLQKHRHNSTTTLAIPSPTFPHSVHPRIIPSRVSSILARHLSTTSSPPPPPSDISKIELDVYSATLPIQKYLQSAAKDLKHAGSDADAPTFAAVFDAASIPEGHAKHPLVAQFRSAYAQRPFSEALDDLVLLTTRTSPNGSGTTDPKALRLLEEYALMKNRKNGNTQPTKPTSPKTSVSRRRALKAKRSTAEVTVPTNLSSIGHPIDKALVKERARKSRKQGSEGPLPAKSSSRPPVAVRKVTPPILVRRLGSPRHVLPTITKHMSKSPRDAIHQDDLFKALAAPPGTKAMEGALIQQTPVETEVPLKVPRLSFDLSRVLFNPGIYHLQDPRSRVYNFDPYLENIMPIHEFNFEALNPYITSSQDTHLRDVALKHKKRYVGSSSSMSAAMSQFHFLLSAWRPPDFSTLSQRIQPLKTFTIITRAPASIYLRWRDGVYAIDADKEYDTPNVLMMQGKSMEKLLTLEKDEFEKYRKGRAGEDQSTLSVDPEAYHYSTVENFLLRSQLDAHDHRLPGSGMFDLKTRAVAGIRMNMNDHEEGMNYQIKQRFGEWESFDREYSDMIRSAFLKYSMQVRMGRMDGIFVAYHNIARIFGFQYISLAELDMALHGQSDTTLGDTEFRLSLKLMNEIFEHMTELFPEQSLRLTFDTRDATKTEPNGRMRVFAEPMTEKEIDQVQSVGKEKFEEYEKSMAEGINPKKPGASKTRTLEEILASKSQSPSTLESSEADHSFLEEVLAEQTAEKEEELKEEAPASEKEIAAYEIRVFNEVNGKPVVRPRNLRADDRWNAKFTFAQVPQDKAKTYYRQSRARRAAALEWDETIREDWFIRRIREMSRAGKVWRAEQDELDAGREKVMLYNTATAD